MLPLAVQAWAANGSLEDQELMAQRQVLKREGRWLEEQGAKEGPEANHEDHRSPPGIRYGV